MQAIAKKGKAVAEGAEAAEADDIDADLIGDVDLECDPLYSTACSGQSLNRSRSSALSASDLCC